MQNRHHRDLVRVALAIAAAAFAYPFIADAGALLQHVGESLHAVVIALPR